MKILVTGCAGFIASHLIEELLKDKSNFIVGIDNFFNGLPENINFLNSLDKDKKFTFVKADIRDFEYLSEIIKKFEISHIFHLAALVSVQESIKNPFLSNEINVKGTLNILEAGKENGVKRVVFSSSAAVYGDDKTIPKDEKSPTKPISNYGCEKLICEEYMKLYSKLYGIETISLRYFNVYGERQGNMNNYSGVINIFEEKIKNDKIIEIYGDGEQYRDFIYVKDIAKINIEVMKSTVLSCNELFCVGTFKKTSINEVYELISKKHGQKVEIRYLPPKDGDIKESVCDNTKLAEMLKVGNLIDFKEGIDLL